jgi:hypothetical protein
VAATSYVLDVHAGREAARRNSDDYDEEEIALLDMLRVRRLAAEPEQTAFAALCDRWDNLYYPQMFTKGGADHWADHFSAASGSGMAHVSVNSYAPYVDIPAALTAFPPIENMVPTEQTDAGRRMATLVERVYSAWKDQSDYEMLCHRACVTKSLYGRTASKVTWNEDEALPRFEVIDQPRNLYLGWASSEYNRLDWACYSYLVTPDTALEDWGVCIEVRHDGDGKPYPYVTYPTRLGPPMDTITGIGPFDPWPISNYNPSSDIRIEVNDYWYRKPREDARYEEGKPVKFETWNAIVVGNLVVKDVRHTEYRGRLPFVPLFNSYLPGLPTGKSNLWDIEQLIREKDERMSENAQMIHKAIAGQMWQLTGPEAPLTVPAGLKPEPNEIIAPGGGNRVEALEPYMPEFQIEQYLTRVDRELVDVSGLNDLMRGMAPTQVMSSGKAVAALVSNYETRMTMPRNLYYQWRRDNWTLAQTVWAEKVRDLREVLEGTTKLIIESPSLTPRDDAEMSSIALNLKEGKLWSAKRAMDRTGVDDPEAEEQLIREEQTDATLNPAQVQVMVSLMMMMQQLQQQQPPGVEQQAAQAQGSIAENMAAMRGEGTPTGTESMNGPGEAPATPPEMMPGNTPEGAALGAGEEVATEALPGEGEAMPSQMLNQFQIKEGEVSNRVVGQQEVQREEG